MVKIVVIGAAGQLGQCINAVATANSITNIVFATMQEADITKPDALDVFFEKERPEFVINCAAYTAVDKAEDELDLARAINEFGAANVAGACKKFGATLIHISTDFVFAGDCVKLLQEDDLTTPINTYGKTKLDGEYAIAQILNEAFIIRTSWLYSEYANNFVKTMLKLGSEREELSIIADQIGSPTYAMDLADAIFGIIHSGNAAYGTYHYSNEGAVSWYDFAMAIFQISDTAVAVKPIPGTAYPTKAQRPAFSVMDKSKIKSTFNLTIPYWRDSLVKCIERMNLISNK